MSEDEVLRTMALKIVEALAEDIEERKGLGNEWAELPGGIQRDIKNTWVTLVLSQLGDPGVR